MFKNYLKIALRNIVKNKVHSTINILGFSIALSVVILLFLYVIYETSADKFHENYKNIYRVQTQKKSKLSAKFAKILVDNFPEFKKVTRIRSGAGRIILNNNEPLFAKNIIFVDSTFFDIFTFDVKSGDIKTALKGPESIVLTEIEADRLFGDENPIGKTISLNNKHLLTVTAVIKNIPKNSSLNFSGVIPIGSLEKVEGNKWIELGHSNFEHYFLCYDKINFNDLAVKIKTYFNEIYPGWFLNRKYTIIPFSKIYFNDTVRDSCQHGNLIQLFILSGIGLLILIIAIINFINLSIARSMKRSLEVGIRKVIGANRIMLICQSLSESILICLFAMGISVVFVELIIPRFNQLFNTSISINIINLPLLLFIFISGGILLGLLAGIYPGIYLTAFNPAKVIKGQKSRSRKAGMVKKGLLVFQFVVSIVLIVCTMIIAQQRFFMQNHDLGFKKENILFLSYTNEISQSFHQELRKHPNIRKLSISELPPGIRYTHSTGTNWKYKGKEKYIHFSHCNVDANLLPLMEFELKEGRLFSDELDRGRRVCIVNETTIREFSIDNPYEAFFNVYRSRTQKPNPAQVVGVIKDFNNRSLHDKVQPFIFFYESNQKSGFTMLKIKSENVKVIQQTIGYVEDLWKRYFPNIPFTYHFLDDTLDNMYKQEARFEKIFASFSLLAIIIACLGLLGLVSFMTEQRTKEIGIRKVLGASVSGIVLLLTKEFTKWVLFANIIAWPIAYFVVNKWLQNFAYRISIGIWSFLLAGALALVIALMTISFQAIKAATANPVEALRYE